MNRLVLLLAHGLGSGLAPFAPGTFGTLAAVPLLVGLLLLPAGIALATLAALTALAVPVCSRAELLLGATDPGSIVIDEIVALPWCATAWVLLDRLQATRGLLPDSMAWRSAGFWLMIAAIFVLFRVFDITKLWPARQIQSWHGGLGVVADDLAAAIHVNLLVMGAAGLRALSN